MFSGEFCESFKVAYRVQIWKKTFCQNSDCFGYRFIKNDMYLHVNVYVLTLYLQKTHYFKPI